MSTRKALTVRRSAHATPRVDEDDDDGDDGDDDDGDDDGNDNYDGDDGILMKRRHLRHLRQLRQLDESVKRRHPRQLDETSSPDGVVLSFWRFLVLCVLSPSPRLVVIDYVDGERPFLQLSVPAPSLGDLLPKRKVHFSGGVESSYQIWRPVFRE